MAWEAPDFVEVKMDAEINSYQDDFGRGAGRPLLTPTRRESDAALPAGLRPAEGLSCFGGATMLIRVLGSAAGGGFPQWNCGCPNCRGRARGDAAGARRARRSRVAVSADGAALVPAQRLARDPRSRSRASRRCTRAAPRHSPIAGHRAHQRRSRSLPRASCRCASRTRWSSTRPTRVRARLHRGQRALPDARALPGPGDLARARARPRGAARWRRRRRAASRSTAVAVPGKLPIHLEALRARRRPRTTSACASASARTRRTLAYCSAVGAARRRRCARRSTAPTACSSTARSGRATS